MFVRTLWTQNFRKNYQIIDLLNINIQQNIVSLAAAYFNLELCTNSTSWK